MRMDVRDDYLAWALDRARAHTLALVADVPREALRRPTAPHERHPAWILGHLLLADTYLLFLLAVEPLPDDFPLLVERFGPASASTTVDDAATPQLIDHLRRTHAARLARVRAMTDQDFAQPLPDTLLAQAQPTIGHHLHSLVFHEGYHSGQLSSWRKTHGLPAVDWTFGPARTGRPAL